MDGLTFVCGRHAHVAYGSPFPARGTTFASPGLGATRRTPGMGRRSLRSSGAGGDAAFCDARPVGTHPVRPDRRGQEDRVTTGRPTEQENSPGPSPIEPNSAPAAGGATVAAAPAEPAADDAAVATPPANPLTDALVALREAAARTRFDLEIPGAESARDTS